MQTPSLSLPSSAAETLIRVYQRFLSPYKGFVCAHRVLHQQESCSEYALRMIREQGWWDAVHAMSSRFRECRAACDSLRSASAGDRISKELERRHRKLQSLPGDESTVSNTCWWMSVGPCPCDGVMGFSACDGMESIGCCIDI